MMKPPEFPADPFTWPMARDLGIPRHRLDDAVRNRQVLRLFVGAYLRADVRLTAVTLAQAASLVIRPGAVMCDRTAAWLHGAECFDYRELDVGAPLECYVLRGARATDRAGCDGGARDLVPADWWDLDGVRVTTPLRTAMDLGCKLSRRDALAVMDALMHLHGFNTHDMQRLLPRYFRRRGVVQLRELVPLVDGRSESTGESWVRLEIHDHGLPAPEPQYWVHANGVPLFRLDLAYPRARVAIEYDGEEFHTTQEDRENDETRRSWLRDHGWTVIVVTKHSFTEQAIRGWIDDLRAALGLR